MVATNIASQSDHAGELRVFRDPSELAHAAAALFVSAAAESIRERGKFRVSLSGGSTPHIVYQLLATAPYSRRIDWTQVELFWGDERYVAPDDPESNYRMTAEALLRHVPLPEANIHRVLTEITPPSACAAAYEDTIRTSFGDSHSIPKFDLIYLGLGDDGHTASLFPYSQSLHDTSHLVLADNVASKGTWRITMSVPLLNRGRIVAFLVQGKQKAEVLRNVRLGPCDIERLPAQSIAPEGHLLWLADKTAVVLPG